MAKINNSEKNDELSDLYSNRDMLHHIEAMSWKFLYIFSFLWGGLAYLYITNPNNEVFSIMSTKITVVSDAFAQDISIKLMSSLPLSILLLFMLVVLIMLVFNMIHRKVHLSKKDEHSFVVEKQKQLHYAVAVGCVVSISIICFIFMILTSPADSLKDFLVWLAKIISQILIFVLLVYLPIKQFIENFDNVKNNYNHICGLWHENENAIYLKNNCEVCFKNSWTFIKVVFYSLWLLMRIIWILVSNSYLMLLGIYLYVIYALINFFGTQIGWIILLLFLIDFMVFLIIYFSRIIITMKSAKTFI